MKSLIVAAAALAAGMVTFVAQSQAGPERDVFATFEKAAARKAPAAKGETKAVDAGAKRQKPAAKTATRKQASAQTRRGKKGRVKIDLQKPDMQTTASIAPRSRPVLKAVARKTVKGLAPVEAAIEAAGAATYTAIVARYASSYGVPASLAQAVVRIESNFSPDGRGGAGEIGLMQIKPATARMMGYGGSASGLFDPETNIRFGMKYLAMAHQLSGGETCGTILRYNAGHGARRMNPVSAAYCSKVKLLIAD